MEKLEIAVLQTQLPQRNKPKQTRTSTPKVRSGCITCKKRHVKCDEAKPHCRNCLQTRGQCEGYAVQPRKNAAKPGQISLDLRNTGEVIRHATHPRLQLKLDPDALDFRDASDLLYFREFVDLARAPWTSAASGSDLWDVTLPQITRNSGPLRSAAMAIGALSVWHRQSKNRSLRTVSLPTVPATKGDAHYFNAVSHYCRSLKLQSQQASLQDVVILSLLFLFFETLRDNRRAALNHVNHGLSLLLALITDENAPRLLAKLAPNPRPFLSAVADIYSQLAKQARTILVDRIDQGPPLPNLMRGLKSKKQTMESFMVLLSEVPGPSLDLTIDNIPSVFESLDEFERSWDAVRKAETAMMPIMMEALQDSGALSIEDGGISEDFHVHLLGDPRIIKFCNELRNAMDALDVAYQPLFNRIITTHDAESPTYLRAIHLRLQYLGVYVFADPPQYLNVKSLNARLPLFREFLFVASIALRAAKREVEKNPAHQLTLQCGIAWHLVCLSFLCRDPLIRDEAVMVLKDYPGQDGLWSTRGLYVLARRNLELERTNMVEGDADEQLQRLWRREFVFEDGGDRIIFRYLERDEATGTWQLVEEVADIPGDPEKTQWKRRPITGSGGLLMAEYFMAELYTSSAVNVDKRSPTTQENGSVDVSELS